MSTDTPKEDKNGQKRERSPQKRELHPENELQCVTMKLIISTYDTYNATLYILLNDKS